MDSRRSDFNLSVSVSADALGISMPRDRHSFETPSPWDALGCFETVIHWHPLEPPFSAQLQLADKALGAGLGVIGVMALPSPASTFSFRKASRRFPAWRNAGPWGASTRSGGSYTSYIPLHLSSTMEL